MLSIVLSICTALAQSQKLGKLNSSLLTEVSGITSYSHENGYFWVHNDSGDKSQVYLIDSLANLKTTIILDGIRLIDCEDIARVELNGGSYLLLADIGNNLKKRETLTIYMFPEPKVDFGKEILSIDKAKIKQISIRYADKPRDAEAIFVDPLAKEVFIVSKRDFQATVFSFPLEQIGKSSVITLHPKSQLPFTFVTAADMSFDGKFILIKNLSTIFMWERKAGEDVIQTLGKPFKQIPYQIEAQGEAICFDVERPYFYTLSERPLGLDAYLIRYIY